MALKKNQLGSSDLMVTEVCLGTMTWGLQNTEEDAHQQLDYAVKERGVNFLDTAENYPMPLSAPGQIPGTTEKYIGTWLAKNPGYRDKIVIATKVQGFSQKSKTGAYRADPPLTEYPDCCLDEKNILQACEASLRRLQTDYIDLYQIHWPDRYVPSVLSGSRCYNPKRERKSIPFKETLEVFKKLLELGKIRHYGLSNETCYGVGEIVRAADELGMPRPVSIQNNFSLLNRSFEGELAECCAPSHYNIGLLPWSVLGGGALTGKYNGKVNPDGTLIGESLKNARFARFQSFQTRFFSPENLEVTARYKKIADDARVSLATLAQAFCASRWYIPSTIVGATTLEQLKENIDAFRVKLGEDVLQLIDDVHNRKKDVYLKSLNDARPLL